MRSLSFWLSLMVLSCSGSDPVPANTNNASNGNNAPTNNASGVTSNAAISTAGLNSNSNNDTILPRVEPYIASFTYRYGSGGVLRLSYATDGEGNATISTGRVGTGNVARLPPDVAAEFDMTHLGASTIEKMRSGWACRAVDSAEPSWFEARIVEDGTAVEAQEITGCVVDDDPAVAPIIEALRRLETIYL